MDLRRRRYLTAFGATAGALALAGCSGDGDDAENDEDEESGDDDDSTTEAAADTEPQYDTGANTELLLSLDAFPDGWVRDDSLNENFDAVFRNEDGSIVVLTTAEIFDTVAAARDRMESARAGVSDPNDYPIGDEAFWATRNDEIACTLFRHSNAVGQACAARESGSEVVPDQARSQDYAQTMYEQWTDV